MSSSNLKGKLVLVTGGAKNVGKTICRRFAEQGAHVIVNFFHSLDASRETVAELRALGATVDVIRASVAQQSQVDRMFDEIEAKYGRLDILVNNAASGALLGVGDIASEHFDRALDTNLKGAFWCARRAAALMARSGGGSIVNVSSVGSTLVPANYLVVGTAKAALESLTRYLAVEYAADNIRVNSASSTLIDGDVAQQFPDPDNTRRSSIEATPLSRLATAEDLADVVLFLASDSSRWVTGQVVTADGGLSLCSEGLSPRPQWATQNPHATNCAPCAQTLAAKSERTADHGQHGDGAVAADELDISDDAIAVVGMGLAIPGANNPQEFWRALLEGPELFDTVPAERWDYRSFHSDDPAAEDKSYQSRSVFMESFNATPALQSELNGPVLDRHELTTLWLRHSLLQALDGVRVRAGDRTSFLVGYTADGSQHLEEGMVLAAARTRLSSALDAAGVTPDERDACVAHVDGVLGARYSRGAAGLAEFFPHRVGLDAMQGVLPDDAEYMMVDTACSSSLYSVDLGIKGLLLGQHDVVACGGAFALAPRNTVLFAKLHGLSRSGEVRPLDEACDGVLFADGAGVVILKRLKRAVADGDRVLGILKAFGSSSDGKGKAIYAPNPEGQGIAIERAYRQSEVTSEQIDWVVAHATGTPAGDLAEFQSLRESLGQQRSVQVTSNKSLVGHTGWAAGVVSLIQVLLGLQHDCIPPQHRYTRAPREFDLATTGLTIPTRAVDWPRDPRRARAAAVSGFGFGGTNGHLVVSEYRPDLPAAPAQRPARKAPLAIVGWSAKFPGLADGDAVAAWLRGTGAAPQASFGLSYPLPGFDRVRMPPAVLRALDRCQLMSLDAAHDLREKLQPFWNAHSDTIGIVMGHMGPTRNAALYASRCYLDDIETALRDAGTVKPRMLDTALAGLRERTRALVPPATENSFPGMMPNVIPARVANYHDLHGMNMTVDAGHASTLAAFEVAARFLQRGELDMVIVGGINGNVADEVQPAFDTALAEGVVLFAVTTQAQAEAAGLPVLAWVETGAPDGQDNEASEPAPRDSEGRALTYAGADAAVSVLGALVREEASATVATRNPGDRARFSLRLTRGDTAPGDGPDSRKRTARAEASQPRGVEPAGASQRENGGAVAAESAAATAATAATAAPRATAAIGAATSGATTTAATTAKAATATVATSAAATASTPPTLAPALYQTGAAADGEPLGVKRYRIDLQDVRWQRGAEPLEFFPPKCVLVTDAPQLLADFTSLPADLIVLSTQPLAAPRDGWHHIQARGETALASLLHADIQHVRVLSSLHASQLVPGQVPQPVPELLALHDLAFLALKHCHDGVSQHGSFIALLLDAVVGTVLHPEAGLFSGLTKALGIELYDTRSLAVFTSCTSAREALAQAEHESGALHLLPVVVLSGTRRLTVRVTEATGELPAAQLARLGPDSVVVAFGGARGITAELMKAVAAHYRPTLYLIGSSRLDDFPPETFAGSDEEFLKRRPEYIREQKKLHPSLPLPQVIKSFERQVEVRAAHRNMEAMKAHCGADRVHYLRADVFDRASVQAAVQQIAARESHIDLVVNAAGLNRSASIPVKTFEDFVAVRDIKVRGYWNLRDAFAALPPRAWCNFGSFIGLTGQSGETDYASGNDFLNTRAAYHRAALGYDEFTIGWTLWRSVGLGANPVTRAFLEKSGLFTSMRTEEGVHHFLRELDLVDRAAASVHLGAPEKRAIEAHLPTFFSAAEAGAAHADTGNQSAIHSSIANTGVSKPVVTNASVSGASVTGPSAANTNAVNTSAVNVNVGGASAGGVNTHAANVSAANPRAVEATPATALTGIGDFYLGRQLQRDADSVTFERVFDLQRDAYLQHHVVNGFATLPGTFVPELAAEAALQLLPGLKVVGFQDAVFHHFLRVYDAQRPGVKRIRAQIVRRDGELTTLQVHVTGDVHAPNGHLLVRDKLHFEIKVLLAPVYEPAPGWARWPDAGHTPIADPYHFAAAPVYLSGMFVSTTDTGSSPPGKHARYQLGVAADDPVFSRFVVPSIMLDGLARVAVLNYIADDYIPLAAPMTIRRIDIYEDGNDCQLASRYDRIDLYATPREFALEGVGSRNRFVAVRPDGRMLMQMKDVSGVIIGYVHRDSGAYVSKAEVDAQVAARALPTRVSA
ncbi:beta keto-acyl synthase [Burkholderia sp. SRS-W-2-2016]|uniref:SDR family oxidoreductase n=1 Tax=Burkholderia sp. SRS-W-2-2016 TaxID=1926878 RepID=UPI00094B52CB|nr:SDR family oxidoreductase [Burkholderia sp. SRS-W-2-2016]OLL27633.1 beta keto-acyl synthase [Burkholderia sp. SRS-W-2-2016]